MNIQDVIDKCIFSVGVGIADITPSIAEVGFMGYGNPGQSVKKKKQGKKKKKKKKVFTFPFFSTKGTGLHFRLHARAFVVRDTSTNALFAYVNIGAAMIFHETKARALSLLESALGQRVFDFNNTLICATHTHSGPGGFTYFPLYDITTLGFQAQSLNVVAEGVASAIEQAFANMRPNVDLLLNVDELVSPQTNINRSPSAYLANPASERAQYAHNTDKNFTTLRFEDRNKQTPIGVINWFAVHGTSMNNTNTLVSGDNKGHAMYLFEKWVNGNGTMSGRGPFVAAFSQTNEGDVSPNTKGAFCEDGTPCEFAHSTCNGANEGCHGYGPGDDMFESTRLIGKQQFEMARKLFASASQTVSGPLRFVHQFVDFSREPVSAQWTGTGKAAQTCPGALGDGFAAGTTDGPGAFNFQQGTNSSSKNPFWNWLTATALYKPNATQIACQAPKPILLDTGEMTFPCPWSANVLPLQLVAFGKDLVIIGVPSEFTTMAGRRLRATVRAQLEADGIADANTVIVISGLANQYSHYVATREEYHQQRYEAASTLFGQFTLAAYQQRFTKLAAALARNIVPDAGPMPADYSAHAFNVLPPVIADAGQFGAVLAQPYASYQLESTSQWPLDGTARYTSSVAVVAFVGADPRGKPIVNGTYLTVEQFDAATNEWVVRMTDDDWDTRFHWRRSGIAGSVVTVEAHLNAAMFDLSSVPIKLRIATFGLAKSLFGGSKPFSGVSQTFTAQ
jgi:neutral ceramidase